MYAHSLLLAVAATLVGTAAAEPASTSTATTTTTLDACVATSTSGAFFDLRPDMAIVPDDTKKAKKGVLTTDYSARGWDYNYNFTLNLCAAVVKPVADVDGLDRADWKNVSAYYESKGTIYSLGQQSSALTSRGRKLTLQYEGGSPCGASSSSGSTKGLMHKRSAVHDGASYKYSDYQDDDDRLERKPSSAASAASAKSPLEADAAAQDFSAVATASTTTTSAAAAATATAAAARRKSATFSFLCDRESMSDTAAISFVAADPDECAYFFEVRSQHACAIAPPHQPGSVGPGGVFAIIFFIAVLVYLIGGVFYQRTVAHARGWRQLPNYSMWSGMFMCIKDFFIAITSSCTQFLPGRRGYRSLATSPTRRNRTRDDENRLIDQLDEEWDD